MTHYIFIFGIVILTDTLTFRRSLSMVRKPVSAHSIAGVHQLAGHSGNFEANLNYIAKLLKKSYVRTQVINVGD